MPVFQGPADEKKIYSGKFTANHRQKTTHSNTSAKQYKLDGIFLLKQNNEHGLIPSDESVCVKSTHTLETFTKLIPKCSAEMKKRVRCHIHLIQQKKTQTDFYSKWP
jgi:hypothetical protein